MPMKSFTARNAVWFLIDYFIFYHLFITTNLIFERKLFKQRFETTKWFEKMKKLNVLLLSLIIFFSFASVADAKAHRTVFIMNDVFMNFDVASDYPLDKVNDSIIVHGGGRIDYLSDGKYILINGKTYYEWLTAAYGRERIAKAWNRAFNGDFDDDVIEFYNNRETYNISHELDLKGYWDKRKAQIVANK